MKRSVTRWKDDCHPERGRAAGFPPACPTGQPRARQPWVCQRLRAGPLEKYSAPYLVDVVLPRYARDRHP